MNPIDPQALSALSNKFTFNKQYQPHNPEYVKRFSKTVNGRKLNIEMIDLEAENSSLMRQTVWP